MNFRKSLTKLKNNCIIAFKRETVLSIALLLAVISAFLVHPDAGYVEYVDFRTLGILFCLMVIMSGLREIGVFDFVAVKMLRRTKSMWQILLALLALTFFSSMIITNDVALITFVPFTIIVLGFMGQKQRWLIPFWIPVLCVLSLVIMFDRRILLRVDYALLGTFIGFFIFIGNMGRIKAFSNFLEEIIAGHEVVTSVMASQVVSNVPAALLLSGFSEEYTALIIGTNIGGLGTLIASMASLISFKCIAREDRSLRGRYILYFTIVNVIFLIAMLLLQQIL